MPVMYRVRVLHCTLVREFDDGRKTFQLDDGQIIYADHFIDRSNGAEDTALVCLISNRSGVDKFSVYKYDLRDFR